MSFISIWIRPTSLYLALTEACPFVNVTAIGTAPASLVPIDVPFTLGVRGAAGFVEVGST